MPNQHFLEQRTCLLFRNIPNNHIVVIRRSCKNIWNDWIPGTGEYLGSVALTRLDRKVIVLIKDSKDPIFTASCKLFRVKRIPSDTEDFLGVLESRMGVDFLSICGYLKQVAVSIHRADQKKIRIKCVPTHRI